jgi:4,5-DOPA dioxygenase extradiol
MNTNKFKNSIGGNTETDKMPVLFVGHGNPMYAISDNKYSKVWREMGKKLVKPKAILCVSAHWLTKGTYVTMMENPKTIHDFYGFPEELFRVDYPAPGAMKFAEETIEKINYTKVEEDYEWGLDHGAWSVLMNIYPMADIPVYQMSVDFSKKTEYHFNLAKELSFLRKKGVLIIGSGNVVHNLRMVKWKENSSPFDWAIEFDEIVKKCIEEDNPRTLIEYEKLGELARLAHPTNDHYLPLMYTLGLREKSDKMEFFNDSVDMGSMSMRSVIFS